MNKAFKAYTKSRASKEVDIEKEVQKRVEEKLLSEGKIAIVKAGVDGKDGYTPKKGEDYFTYDEIRSFTQQITDGVMKSIKIPVDGKDGKDGRDGKDGKKGVDGRDGKDGYTPVKGEDYFTASEIRAIQKRVKEMVERMTGKEIVEELEKLRGGNRLDASAIKNLSKYMVGGGGGGSSGGALVEIYSSNPSSPTEGQLIINSTSHTMMVYYSGGWRELHTFEIATGIGVMKVGSTFVVS